MIRILMVEDQILVRTAIVHLLQKNSNLRVTGQASDSNSALELIRSHHYDVILLDFKLPGLNGLELAEKIKRIQPDAKIIVLTSGIHQAFINRLLSTGIRGFLTKDMSHKHIVEAIETVSSGGSYISPDIASQLILNSRDMKDSPIAKLSNRELQIILLVAQNLSIENIANLLHISPKTVCSYRYKIYEKLDVQNDVELIHFALKNDLVEIEP